MRLPRQGRLCALSYSSPLLLHLSESRLAAASTKRLVEIALNDDVARSVPAPQNRAAQPHLVFESSAKLAWLFGFLAESGLSPRSLPNEFLSSRTLRFEN